MSRRETYETRTEELLLPIAERFGVEIYDVEGIQTNTIYYNDTSIDTKTESVIISHGYYNGSTDVVVYVQYKRRFHWLFPVEKRDKKGIMIYLSEDNFDKITQQVITE